MRLVWGLGLLLISSCNLDTDRPAPTVPPPTQQGACGTTETLLPKLLEFVAADRFEPLRVVLERRFIPSETNPQPDPSLRTILGALVRLVSQLGLDETAYFAHIASGEALEAELGPLLVHMLSYVDGRLDGTPHYEAVNGAALFVRVCNPDHLLTAIEMLLRLQSPSANKSWLIAVLEEVGPLLADPELLPFLASFEQNSETGRPAVVSLVRQIMAYVADSEFRISRVETLLSSAVYPAIGPSLETRIERFVVLLDEATSVDANILIPIQGALQCGLQHAEARDAIIGFLYDVAFSEEVGLRALIDGLGIIAADVAASEFILFADAVNVVRTDLTLRDDMRELLAVLLSSPDAELVVPVLLELFRDKVVTELLEGVVLLLDGCGRA